ncbi:MAG: TetR/AcrR family transcriptional regulator [Flavobacteriales bacterium]|nr:TetR/AcrR family transcriptional regulator [Flavobacteriales bacterium]
MNFTNRQIEIIKAATFLIGKKGIQNLTTKNLAAEMGFSEPALYRHFENKTDILQSVLTFYRQQMKEGIEKLFTNNKKGAEKIKGLMDFQFNHFSENPAVVMVIFCETNLQYDEVLSKSVLSILTQKKTMLEQIIQLGQKDQSIRSDFNPSQLADIIMGSMRFTILRWRLSNFDFDLVKEGDKLWNTINKILRCPKE